MIKGIDEPFSDDSDLDEAISAMDEEDFKKMYDQLQTIDVENEEEVQKIVQEKVKEWFNKKNKKRYQPKPSPDKKKNPYEYMLQDDRESIYSIAQDEFILSLENKHKHRKIINSNIGRYPIGFRHFENYDNYRVKHPESTIQEYHDLSKFSLYPNS